jgi:flagellin
MSWTLSDSGFYNIISAMSRTQVQQQTVMARLSTSQRINSAADDPSGLIASLLLGSELSSIQAASQNASRANSMLATADGAIGQISGLVTDIKSLATSLANDGGLTADEKQAKQSEIDSAIASIDRLVNTTSYNGKNLINGTYGIATAGVDPTKITDVDITGKASLTSAAVNVKVVSAAEKGQVSFTGAGMSALNSVTLNITGNLGSMAMNFAGGATIAQMATQINAASATTGVHASASGGKLYMVSQHYGGDELVKVETLGGTFSLDGGVTQDTGKNANVTVNGQTAGVHGLDVSFNTGAVSGNITLKESFTAAAGGTEAFTATGGGATFALAPSVTNLSNIGMSNLTSSKLGNGTLGYLNSLGTGGANCAMTHPNQAAQIADAAGFQVARARANVGAFQKYTIGSMQNMLAQSETSLSSSISNIMDTDYATEVANMTRLNTLYQAQISTLAMMGKQTSSLLNLFGSLN